MVDRTYTRLMTQSQCHIQNTTEYDQVLQSNPIIDQGGTGGISQKYENAKDNIHEIEEEEEEEAHVKTAYGNAFSIYALSAYVRVSGDADALNLAKRAFFWLDRCSYDPVHLGYYQFLRR